MCRVWESSSCWVSYKGERGTKGQGPYAQVKTRFWNRLCCQQQHRYEEFQPLLPTVGGQTQLTQARPVLPLVLVSLRLAAGHSWSIWVTYHLCPKHIGIIKLPGDTALYFLSRPSSLQHKMALGSNSSANICQAQIWTLYLCCPNEQTLFKLNIPDQLLKKQWREQKRTWLLASLCSDT